MKDVYCIQMQYMQYRVLTVEYSNNNVRSARSDSDFYIIARVMRAVCSSIGNII